MQLIKWIELIDGGVRRLMWCAGVSGTACSVNNGGCSGLCVSSDDAATSTHVCLSSDGSATHTGSHQPSRQTTTTHHSVTL